MSRLGKKFITVCQKHRFVFFSLWAVPVLMGLAWLLFPVLETRNWGYRAWHLACESGFFLSVVGIAAWLAERFFGERKPGLFSFLALVGFAIGAIALRIKGDWYWAFERGYFLGS